MKAPAPNSLARLLRGFFAEHLPNVRGASPHTIRSYRDTFILLLRFLAGRRRRPVVELEFDCLDPESVLAFLNHLEQDRRNSASTRNARLAAVHAFARFAATRLPECLDAGQRLLAVPFKRARAPAVEYLEASELGAMLNSIDRKTRDGRRDYALLLTLFNTGARVQELLDLRPRDLRLEPPCQARLLGKGKKERFCPLWAQTAEALNRTIADTGLAGDAAQPLFRNHGGTPLTRFGVRYLLRKYAGRASAEAPTLAQKRMHPHTLRHSTAVHLLQAGVDLVSISHWLGHASIETTNRYAEVDLETKRQALEKAGPIGSLEPSLAHWHSEASILEWLESL